MANKYAREPYHRIHLRHRGYAVGPAQAVCQAVCKAVCRTAKFTRTPGGIGLDALKLYAEQDAEGVRSTLRPTSRACVCVCVCVRVCVRSTLRPTSRSNNGRLAVAKANLTLHPLKHERRAWHMLERVELELELGLSKAAVIHLPCQ